MTQPHTLPPGLWQSLLPKALTLIDEISKHGGVAEPFFTFGGGTALMLRYGHRASKDIDFFVPDPQALGYVTPRLSDVAEAMCDSQYSEAANFVKLHLSEGEIDFVASPNLLPDTYAFETWTLFDRPVRVETAAEIVAKKMYHRGHQGTARDLFDLAMVIEREPTALERAQDFMYRHLEVYAAALASPPDAMKARFEAIETLNYTPTFDDAANVVSHYLAGLRAIRESSASAAASFVRSNGMNHHPVDAAKGEYSGPIVHRTERHVVQSVGTGLAVIHDVESLDVHPARRPSPGRESVRVRYRHGSASLTPAHG